MIKLLLSLLAVLLNIENVYSENLDNFIIELNDDMYTIFLSDPIETDKIIMKYKDNKAENTRKIKGIINDSKIDQNTIVNAIYILAVLKERSAAKDVLNVKIRNKEDFNKIAAFYYYITSSDREKNLKYLRDYLDQLVTNPSDDILITFLAFFEDVEFSLIYLDKLSNKADGATSELISCSVNYLYHINIDNPQNLKKIIRSSTYTKYGKPKGKVCN
jgi:hypothetical protein